MCEIGFRQFPPSRTHELLVRLRRRCRRDTYDRVIAVCRDKLAGFPAQAVGSLLCLDCVNPPPEPVPERNNASIRGPQMLQTVDGNGPLTNLGLIVTRLPLARLVGVSGKLAGGHVSIRPPHRRGAWGLTHMPELNEHGMGVVRRHDPTAHHRTAEGMLLVTIFPDRAHLLQVR